MSRAKFFRSHFSETKQLLRLGAGRMNIGSRKRKAVARFFPIIAYALPT